MRGYLSRAIDEDDRRQLIVSLTERGRAAAEVQSRARDGIDAELVERIGEDDVLAARRALATLIEIRLEEARAAQ